MLFLIRKCLHPQEQSGLWVLGRFACIRVYIHVSLEYMFLVIIGVMIAFYYYHVFVYLYIQYVLHVALS